MRKNKTKAFTLVEVIVVMVIIAILAALFMPSLTKYIDKANSTQTVVNAREFYVAAQAGISEQYAINKSKMAKTTQEFKDEKSGQRVARITNSSFYDYQRNAKVTAEYASLNVLICKNTLFYLNSDSKNGDNYYKFKNNNKPMGIKPSEFYKTASNQGQPMLALYYNAQGQIVLCEYADESLYKVTIRDNELTVEKDGVFMKELK